MAKELRSWLSGDKSIWVTSGRIGYVKIKGIFSSSF
jgi:hypothetical protein